MAEVFTDIPEAGAERSMANAFEIAGLAPSGKTACRYPGSPTTPPCPEGVAWTMFDMLMTVSPEQLAAIRAICPQNNRPAQPLNRREVEAGCPLQRANPAHAGDFAEERWSYWVNGRRRRSCAGVVAKSREARGARRNGERWR